MNVNENKINFFSNTINTSKQDTSIMILPPEVLENIFSHLNIGDVVSTALVNRHFKEVVISAEKHEEEYVLSRKLAEFFAENLPEKYKKEKEILCEIAKKIPDSENLRRFRFLTRNLRGRVAILLEKVENKDLKDLRELFLKNEDRKENIFDKIFYYKSLNSSSYFCLNFERFGIIENYYKAVEIAKKFSNIIYNRIIFEKLVRSGYFNKTIEEAKEIKDGTKRDEAFSTIACKLADIGKFDKAVYSAEKIDHYCKKDSTLQTISQKLLGGSNFVKAIEVAEKIIWPYLRTETLFSISKEVLKRGDCDKAIEVAEKIDCSQREFLFLDISEELLRSSNFDKAIEFAEKIEENYFLRCEALIAIFKEVLKRGHFDRAIEVAKKLPKQAVIREKERGEFLSDILKSIKRFK